MIGSRGETEDVINLISAEVVVSILAVNVMVVDVTPTNEEIAPFYTPDMLVMYM